MKMPEAGTIFQKPFKVWRTSTTHVENCTHSLSLSHTQAFLIKQGDFSPSNLFQVLFSSSSPFTGLGTQTAKRAQEWQN